MDWWQKRQSSLRRQLVVNVVALLLMTSLVADGIRDQHRVGLIIGVIGILIWPWAMFRTWRQLQEHDAKV